MGGGTGSVATHMLLLRCCAAPQRCAPHDPPTFPLFLSWPQRCASWGRHKKEKSGGGASTHITSRGKTKTTKLLQPQGALAGAIGHFGTKNAPEAKRRILLTLFLFVSQLPTSADRRQRVATPPGGVALGTGCCGGRCWGTPLGQCCWKGAPQNISPEISGRCRNLARKWKRDGGFTLAGNSLVNCFEPASLLLLFLIVATFVPEGL